MTLEKRVAKDAKKLLMFKDKYKGKRCFIVGNGPSLKMEDLEKLHVHGEYSFGANGIHLAFNQTRWKPTFYTVSDQAALLAWYHIIKKLDVKYKFIGDRAFRAYDIPQIKNAFIYPLIERTYYPYCPDFSNDITKAVGNSYTVTYINMQIASYMGFNEIYLIGIDHSYDVQLDSEGKIIKNKTKNYFIDNYTPASVKGLGMSRLYLCDKAYVKAELYSQFHDFKIYNATRGGKLEIFERIDFDKIVF